LNGRKAYREEDFSPKLGYGEYIIFGDKSRGLILDFSLGSPHDKKVENQRVFNQMLSTFRFID
jgi:hypothetical protein